MVSYCSKPVFKLAVPGHHRNGGKPPKPTCFPNYQPNQSKNFFHTPKTKLKQLNKYSP
jgi:hypothetical protein